MVWSIKNILCCHIETDAQNTLYWVGIRAKWAVHKSDYSLLTQTETNSWAQNVTLMKHNTVPSDTSCVHECTYTQTHQNIILDIWRDTGELSFFSETHC